MSYRSKIKICGIKSAAEARAVLACSSAFCANLERADGAKNLLQSDGESSIKKSNFCGENSERNFNSDAENSTRNFNSGSKNFAPNFNQGGENFTCRTQNHVNFTPEQNCDCDKNFGSSSRSQGDDSGVRVEFLGAIFVSSSKRRVSIETAREIARIAHENGAKCVGVFALSSEKHSVAACENFSGKACGDEIFKDKIYAGNSGGVEFYEAAEFCEKQRDDLSVNLNANCAAPASIEDLNSEIFGAEALSEEQILKICEACKLDCAQIYGRISADFKARLNAADIEAWQVLSIGAEMPPLEGLSFDRILFDAKGASLGGNGVSFDWDLLRRAGLGYQGRDGATSDEKNCAGNTMQSTGDARGDLECNAICENCGEEKFYAECVENSGTKPIGSDNHRAANDDEASRIVRDVARSSEAKPAIENYGCDAKGGEECEVGACTATQSNNIEPAKEGSDHCGANDYEAGALNIANDGGEVGKLGTAKDDSADKCSTASKGGAISFILAGGIGAQNILEALALCPYAIDLNSCVEDARGIKDPQKISEILRIIENADGAAD
jgi:phosphoribosylanthranilate isomerase